MRIAFYADLKTANGFYRALSPMTALAKRGHSIRQVSPEDDLSSLHTFEVLFIHRFADPATVRLAKSAYQQGLGILWDNDDNFAGISKDMPAYRELGGLRWERRRTDMRRIFETATVVTSPSTVLSEVHRRIGARAVDVIPNRVSEDALTRPHGNGREVVIGWVAGGEHRFDVRKLGIDEVLSRVIARVPAVRVHTVGLSLGIHSDRYQHSAGVPLGRLIETVASFDIGIAPLSDVPINHSRSDIKIREYAAAGVPWLASPRGPYTDHGADQGGWLVADESWEESLVKLATDGKARRKLSKTARKWAGRETIEGFAGEWERVLNRAIAERQAS